MSSALYLRPPTAFVVGAVLAACGLSSASLKGQTIRGTLLERGSDSPIHLGFVGMYTESGDSVTSTITFTAPFKMATRNTCMSSTVAAVILPRLASSMIEDFIIVRQANGDLPTGTLDFSFSIR